jgi:transposase-like protein
MKSKEPAEKAVRDIRHRTRRQYSSEEKIRIVLEGPRGETRSLKELVAELSLENRLLKKSMIGPYR